jgi:hypothetical protein
VNSRIR